MRMGSLLESQTSLPMYATKLDKLFSQYKECSRMKQCVAYAELRG